MQSDEQGYFQTTRGSDAEMGRILALGFAMGVPTAFVLSMVICALAGIGWGPAAVVATWGAVVGGPFFGVSLLLKRVSELDADSAPSRVPTATTSAEPPRRVAA